MPELPEVETVARRLQEVLPGKTFQSVDILKDKSFTGRLSQLLDYSITDVTRRAKFISIHLSNNSQLVTHLKMTGQLIFMDQNQRTGGGHPSADWTRELPSSHTRIHYHFTDGSQLFFNDQRIFGWMRLMDLSDFENETKKYGPDIYQLSNTDKQQMIKRIQKSHRAIKLVLLDQNIVAGLGNIYACEALWWAQIDPRRPANSLSSTELLALLDQAIALVKKAIQLGGTTYHGHFVHIDGLSGKYQKELRVYDKEGQPCPRCRTPLNRSKQGGRSTWYCPNCQN